MAEGLVQRRGVPQVAALAVRFGQETLGGPVELPAFILPVAKVTRVDKPSMGTATVPAQAGKRSQIQLFNPAGSNTDILLKRAWVSCSSASTVTVRTHDTALTTLVATVASLIRSEGSSQLSPLGQVRTFAGTIQGSLFGLLGVEAVVTKLLDFTQGDGEEFDGAVIEPGRGLLLDAGTDNIVITTTFLWLERQTG